MHRFGYQSRARCRQQCDPRQQWCLGALWKAMAEQKIGLAASRNRSSAKTSVRAAFSLRWIEKTSGVYASRRLRIDKDNGWEVSRRRWIDKIVVWRLPESVGSRKQVVWRPPGSAGSRKQVVWRPPGRSGTTWKGSNTTPVVFFLALAAPRNPPEWPATAIRDPPNHTIST